MKLGILNVHWKNQMKIDALWGYPTSILYKDFISAYHAVWCMWMSSVLVSTLQIYMLILRSQYVVLWLFIIREYISLLYRILLLMVIIHFKRTRGESAQVPAIKIAVITKHEDPSLLGINKHLKPKNTNVTKELINNFQNNSLEPVLFERLDSIRIS